MNAIAVRALGASLLLAAAVTRAQGLPAACQGPGVTADLDTYLSVVEISRFEEVCSAIAPASLPAFARMLAPYREAAPACVEAARAAPELAAFHDSPERAQLLDRFSAPGPEADALRAQALQWCQSLERQAQEHRAASGQQDQVFSEFLQQLRQGD